MNINVRRRLTRTVLTLLNWSDPELAEAWFWNLTPMPIGLPSNRQLFEGVTVFWLGFGRLGFCMERAEKRTNAALREVNEARP